MGVCQHVGCSEPADCQLEASGEVESIVAMCRPCRESFLRGWERLLADAEALRERGVPTAMLNRIMCARVDRDVY